MTHHLRRWGSILRMTFAEARDDQVSIVSSGVAFRVALSVFPAVALLLWTGRRLIGPEETRAFLHMIQAVVPDNTMQVIRQAADTSSAHGPGERASLHGLLGLGAPVIGVAFTVWSANSGMTALFGALNIIYDKTERRSYPRFLALTLAFTLATLMMIFAATALVMALPTLLEATSVPAELRPWIAGLRWPVLIVIIAFALAVLYRYAPYRDREHWPLVTVGSVLASVLVTGISAMFSWFVAQFAGLSMTYGSLGSVVAYLLWLWAIFAAILICAELDACVESETGLYGTGSAPKRKANACRHDVRGDHRR